MKKSLVIFLVILSTFFWGTNCNVGAFVVTHINPLATSGARFSVAAILMFFIILPQWNKFWIACCKNAWIFLFMGAISLGGGNGILFIGLKYTSAMNAALIMATNPIAAALLSALIMKTKITTNQKIGMLLSLIGVLGVITQGSWDALIHLHLSSGDAVVMTGNIVWALYSVLNNRYVKDSTPLITTTATVIIGAITLMLLASLQTPGTETLLHQSWLSYTLILYMGICGTTIACLFWNIGIDHLGASQTSLFYNLLPIFTALITLLTGTKLHLIYLTWGALVIIGVFISMLQKKKILKE